MTPAPHLIGLVWRLYIQRMERRGGMSESGRLAGILGTCGACWSLNLSLSLEDWENFSIVHAPPTFCLLSQELLCDWAWLHGGKVRACPGHRKHENLSLCWGPCSYFSPDTLDLLRCDFSHSYPCLPVPSTRTHTCLHMSNSDLGNICLCFPKPSQSNIKNKGHFQLPLPSFIFQ